MEVTLDAALSDVEARFLYNLPESELSQPDRLFFQIEQAWWYYEDFKADRFPQLPHFAKLQSFAQKVFSHCPLLANHATMCDELFRDFSAYKATIPVYGVIMLSPDMKKFVLVCSYKGNSWGFPRGKVNQTEAPLSAAVREALEETGFDAAQYCNEADKLTHMEGVKPITLYIASNVPESAYFETQTRKEISKIAFFPIDAVPKNSYGVNPFIQKLNWWIKRQREKKGGKGAAAGAAGGAAKKASRTKGGGGGAATARGESAVFDGRNRDTFADEHQAGAKGWGVDDMFNANARLTGRDYSDYDGNPHSFGASHPRYVNFNEKQQQQQQQKELTVPIHGSIRILSRDAATAAAAASASAAAAAAQQASSSSSSSTSSSQRPSKWPRFSRAAFTIDRAAVMADVDASLAATAATAFAGAVF